MNRFGDHIEALPFGKSAEADDLFESLTKQIEQTDRALDIKVITDNEKAVGLIKSLLVNAPYLRDSMIADPLFLIDILLSENGSLVSDLIAQTKILGDLAENEKNLMRDLRQAKRRVALFLAMADLGRFWGCEEVTKRLSLFADAALLSAVRFSLREEEKRGKVSVNNPETPEAGSGLVVLAMGKHGALELNYSSDIDIVVFYDAACVQCRDPHELQPAMVRVVKRVVKLLQERTEHGYVFRTDLRLRPDPGATAIAISTDAALNYYESLGQNWERAAFIKARPVACDMEAANHFLQELSPFVWRKYMDFATISDVRAMKRQTHLHKGHAEIAIRGHNVKLGRGGIREIEFFVQTQQLIAGGRNPLLRERATLKMLGYLAELGWIDHDISRELKSRYCFLRDVEHRIQMRFDEQTHVLPKDDEAFEAVAHLVGFGEIESFEEALLSCFESVSDHYSRLFEDEETLGIEDGPLVFTGDNDDPETLETLTKLGFENVSPISGIVRSWHMGRYRAMHSERARAMLTQIMPKLLEAIARTAKPDAALYALDEFLKSLPAGVQLFSMLKENEQLLDLMARVLGSAPRLSETIARRPHVFDALLDPAFFDALPDRNTLHQQLQVTVNEARDYEDLLDRVRIFTKEKQFLIGTRLLSDTLTVSESQTHYANLADCVIEELLEAVKHEISLNHGAIAGSDVAVLAMGKLGSKEMTPSSDLDLILIYEVGEDVKQSDGQRPLAVSQYFARITQRFIAALSAPTGEGVAYEVDMRLRPSGKAGPLATDIQAFTKYQRETAWTWEHMALTRARVIAGSAALQNQISGVIQDVLIRVRDEKTLKADVLEMSERIHQAKSAKSVWDIKEVRGGLIDLEFIIQYHQLARAAKQSGILEPNTAKALYELAANEGLTQTSVASLAEALELYSTIQQFMRLCFDKPVDLQKEPGDLIPRLCAYTDMPDIARLEVKLADTQASVIDVFNRVFDVS